MALAGALAAQAWLVEAWVEDMAQEAWVEDMAQEAWVEDMLVHSREPAAARLLAVLPAVSGPARTAPLAVLAAEAPVEATAPLAMWAVAKATTSRRQPTSMSGAEATST